MNVPGTALAVAVIVFLAIRLGPSLAGVRVFLNMDVLRLWEPWNFTDNHSVTSFQYGTDQIDAMIPALREARDRFLAGDWPSWTNHVTGGEPLLSLPSLGVLTPGRWLYLVLPTWLAPAWSKLVELGFAGWFSFLFCRRLGSSRLAGAIAAVIYPLTGFMIGWNNYPQVAVGSIIPMLFWATERFLQQRRVRALVPVALASAFLLFGGFPAVAGQAFYVVGGYAVVRLVVTHRARLRRLFSDAAGLLVACGIGVGLTAFQLLPFASQILGGSDLGYRSSQFFSQTPIVAALSSLFPRTFSTNQLCCNASPQDINTYVGAVVLFLALLGVWQSIAGRVQGAVGIYFCFVIVAVLVLIWFPGWWTSWLDHLPVFHGNPIGRIRSQLGVPIAVLAAVGVDAIRGLRWSAGWLPRVPDGNRVTLGIAVGTLALTGALAWRLHSHGYPFVTPVLRSDALIAGVPLALIVLLSLVRRARSLLLAVVAAAVVVQGFFATSFFWPTSARAEFYPSDPAINFLRANEGPGRIATTGYTLRPNVTEYYGLRDIVGHNFLDPSLEKVILAIDPTALLGPTYTGFTSAVGTLLGNPGLERMGVRYVVASVDDVMPGRPAVPVPIPGAVEAAAQPARSVALAPNRQYSVTIAPGPLRGVNVPVTAPPGTRIAVVVRDQAGRVVAQNSRRLVTGASLVPVPLADDPVPGGASPQSGHMTVSVAVDRPGARASVDTAGAPALQVVRPPASNATYRLAYAADGLVIWEQLNYLPRIHWADTATVIPDATARAKAVASSPLRPGEVILSAPPAGALPAGGGAPAALRIATDNGDNIDVDVAAPTAGYLVVSDSIQSQFSATVDGHATPIVSADGAGGAVYVPQGKHEVRVAYTPSGRAEGTIISAVSAVVIVAATVLPAWFCRRRRRRRRGAAAELVSAAP